MLNTLTLTSLILICSITFTGNQCDLVHEPSGKVLHTFTGNYSREYRQTWQQFAATLPVVGSYFDRTDCCTCSATDGCCPAGCANEPGTGQLWCCIGCGIAAGCNVDDCMAC